MLFSLQLTLCCCWWCLRCCCSRAFCAVDIRRSDPSARHSWSKSPFSGCTVNIQHSLLSSCSSTFFDSTSFFDSSSSFFSAGDSALASRHLKYPEGKSLELSFTQSPLFASTRIISSHCFPPIACASNFGFIRTGTHDFETTRNVLGWR